MFIDERLDIILMTDAQIIIIVVAAAMQLNSFLP
jgi:hypothetical protein